MSLKRVLSLLLGLALIGWAFQYYAAPLPKLLLEPVPTKIISDGTDPAGLPFFYGIIRGQAHQHPSSLLFGAGYTDQLQPPQGYALWIPWIEKLFVAISSFALPLEKIPGAFLAFLFALNGVCFYGFARLLGWRHAVAWGLAICWAFNPYTHVRASVHPALVGTYVLPLAGIGILKLLRGDRRSAIGGSLAFLLVAMGPHYYIVSLAVILSIGLGCAFLRWGPQRLQKELPTRNLWAVLPATVLLLWSFSMPVPPAAKARLGSAGRPHAEHPEALQIFGLHPLHFLTTDIQNSTSDWNPLRQALNHQVQSRLEKSNPQESTQGVRWPVLLLAALGMAWMGFGYARFSTQERAFFAVFALVGALGFVFGLSPPESAPALAPAQWLNWAIPNIRVPSRFGIYTQFALLMMAGITIQALWRAASGPRLWARPLSLALVALCCLDYRPSNPLPTEALQPRRESLELGRDDCGTGIFLPYLSNVPPWAQLVKFYHLLQQFRGTRCAIYNRMDDSPENDQLTAKLGFETARREFETGQSQAYVARALRLIRCLKLDWVAFSVYTPPEWARSICTKLGWTALPDQQCRSSDPRSEFPKTDELSECLLHL